MHHIPYNMYTALYVLPHVYKIAHIYDNNNNNSNNVWRRCCLINSVADKSLSRINRPESLVKRTRPNPL